MHEQETQLVELVLSGRTEAFEPLVTPYRQLLLTLAFRLSRNFEEAKEISQETLLRAFRYLRSYDRQRSFKNWLLQIEMNVWRQAQKKNVETERLAEMVSEHAPGNPAETHHRREIRAQLFACLDDLSPREREIFLLRDVEEMSIKETVRISRISAVSVRVHLSSARKKIREKIKERFSHLLEERP